MGRLTTPPETAWRFLQHDHIILLQAVGGIVSPSQVTLKQDRKDLAGETRVGESRTSHR